MVINNKFNIKQIVYLKTDVEQLDRMVTSIGIRENGLMYELSCGTATTWHTSAEIDEDKNYM